MQSISIALYTMYGIAAELNHQNSCIWKSHGNVIMLPNACGHSDEKFWSKTQQKLN